MAFLFAVSFQDGSGSPAMSADAGSGKSTGNAGSAAKADSIARRLTPKNVSFRSIAASWLFPSL
jgi:hypothetical protein